MKASASISRRSLRPKAHAPATFAAKADSKLRLILFDIDGTLVLTGGSGARAMNCAFEELFGIPDAFRGVQMAGRTDTWILHDALAVHGVSPQDPRVRAYTDVYFRHLPREIANTPPGPRNRIMPGIRELLDALAARDDVYLALLTGNYETAARLKLEHFDLWRYFDCGAYGDTPDRNSLFAVAVERVIACGGPTFTPEQTIVIGDTPHDVGVALASGARSIGVATGSHSTDDLRRAGADTVFEDLSDTLAVLEAF